MASTQQLKARIGSVKNTKQITKAMEMVAASKMRRAQEHALASRAFQQLARHILRRLREVTDVSKHELFQSRPIQSRLYVFITSDRGLAGAFNSNLFRALTQELQRDVQAGVNSHVIAIGRKGAQFVRKLDGVDTIGVYEQFPETPTAQAISPVLRSIIDEFTNERVDSVDMIYTHFESSISQVVRSAQLLPAATSSTPLSEKSDHTLVEPSPSEVVSQVTERLVEVQLNQAFNESQASEHSARMMAMKSASDNAGDLIEDLTLAFNTARQAAITQELAEITGGAEAIK